MGAHSRPRRPPSRWALTGLGGLLALDLIVSGAAVAQRLGDRPAGDPGRSHGRTTSADAARAAQERADRARTDAVRRLLDERSRALLTRDRAAFLATLDPRSPAFRAREARRFDNLAAVPLGSWSYDVDPSAAQPLPAAAAARYHATTWAPGVTLHYTLSGYDASPTSIVQRLTFVDRDGRWLLAADSDLTALGFHAASDLWDFGPVAVVRGERSLVLGVGQSAAMLHTLAQEADRDVPRVSAVWGAGWAQRVVIEAPDSQAHLSRLIDSDEKLDQIAAVATAELGGAGSHGPVGDRIIVNPPNFAKLGPLGRRVVLTHEITHVATRRATGDASPSWLVEGIADYIAYQGFDLPTRSAARELADDVQAGRLPARLPTDAEFDGANPKLPQVYEGAWLACRLIAHQAGQEALLRFYRAVGEAQGGDERTAVDAAFRSVLHSSTVSFTAAWRAYLRSTLS